MHFTKNETEVTVPTSDDLVNLIFSRKVTQRLGNKDLQSARSFIVPL